VKNKKYYKAIKIILLINLIISFLFSEFAFANTKINGVERVRQCDDNGRFKFDELYITEQVGGVNLLKIGNEMDFNMKDPICLTEVLANYLVIKGAILGITRACGVAPPYPHPAPIDDFKKLTKSVKRAPSNSTCAASLAIGGLGAITTALVSLGFPYELAKAEFNRVRICGSDWLNPNPITKVFDEEKGSYSELVKRNRPSSKRYENEFRYGGKSFKDRTNNPADLCYDPITNEEQVYYLRGLKSGNFLCEKYHPANAKNDRERTKYKISYDCCLKKRKNYICLEKTGGEGIITENKNLNIYMNSDINSYEHIFCKVGTKCNFKNNQAATYEAFYRDNNRLICAKSTSFCPFNFSIGGGTPFPVYPKDGVYEDGKFKPFNPSADCPEKVRNKEYNSEGCKSEIRSQDLQFNSEAGKMKNYCQYYTHCTVIDNTEFKFDHDFLTPYFSKACIDFVGDSKNGSGRGVSMDGSDYISQQNHFSAPIVQCIKETMENVFYNKAGHSRCLDGSYGDRNHECSESSYNIINGRYFKKGNKVNNNSHFENLQIRLKNIITLILVISITFFGFKVLMMSVDLQNKKEIMVYLIKIAIVIYFVNGTAWRDVFFDGIYNGSAEISKIFFKIKPKDIDNEKCNFGSLYDKFGNLLETSASYPADAKYLMIWDTLDCKIMQYLNYGPGLSSSTIMMLIVAFFFTGGIGVVFFTAILILAFCLISVVIRAMHIFIASSIAIIIYVFVSPIIMPLMLFEKTKSIFDAWLSHLISFSLQPIILFSYVAIFISLSEHIMFDKAIYKDGNLICEKYCLKSNLELEYNQQICKQSNLSTYDPKNQTPACILGFNDFKKNSTFAIFGIGLIGLDLLNDEDLNFKLILIIKTAVFLFALAQMMDQIPDITTNLIGENIDVKAVNYLEMMKKLNDNLKGVQKRLARFTKMNSKRVGKKFQKDGDGESNSDSQGGASAGGEGANSDDGSNSSVGGEDSNKG